MKDDDMSELMDDALDPIQVEAASWFARLRADDASAADHQNAEAWMAADPRHRAAYQQLQKLWASLGAFAASAEVDQRLSSGDIAPAAPAPANHLPAPPQPAAGMASARRRSRRLRWLAATAAAVVAVVVGFRLLAPSLPLEQQYATQPGELRSITLDDGSVVELDADSRMRVRYSGQERRIALDQGRAFFQVARDAARPLSVDTNSGSVRVIGTRFEVSRHATEMSVSLFEGKVQLRQAGNAAKVLGDLVPGQRARVGADAILHTDSVVLTATPAWMQGQLVFDDVALSSAIEEFNRYGGTPMQIADPALQQLRVSGVFRSNDAASFVQALRASYQLSSHNDGKHIQLRREGH